jgi:amino acid adenylation domain-containing protein/thioester reductase-like protein/non-ribosomal peptide synthase protein (TIGR01720 family)
MSVTVTWLFEKIARAYPNRIALMCEGRSCTYSELDKKANKLARLLLSLRKPGEWKVGVSASRSIETVVAMIGIMKAGAAYIPLDTDLPEKRLSFQLTEAGAKLMVVTDSKTPLLPPEVKTVSMDYESSPLIQWGDEPLGDMNRSEDPLYVIFTSGSTGEPKGAMISHGNMSNYAIFMKGFLGLSENLPLAFAHVSSFSADIGNTCLFPSLLSGGCLHILHKDVYSDPLGLRNYYSQNKIDVCKITPSHLKALLGPQGSSEVLPRKILIFGGEALDFELVEKVKRLVPGLELLNHYGPTETTVGVACTRIENLENWKRIAATVPIGNPITGAIFLVADRTLNAVPDGEPGELLIGGECVGLGYVNKKELTENRFLKNVPSHKGTVFYKTGDSVRRLPDGTFEFLGRVDRQVKIRGYRVELDEVERCLRAHPGIKDAHVTVLNRPTGTALVAFFMEKNLSKDGGAKKLEEISDYLKSSLPPFMLPFKTLLVTEFPLTLSGKVDLKALAQLVETSRAENESGNGADEDHPVTKVWKSTLKLSTVGLDDDFFSIGGDSVTAIMMSADFQRRGIRLHPQVLLENPTIRQQILLLENTDVKIHSRSIEDPPPGPFRLTPVQDWFFSLKLPQPHHYNQAVMLDGTGTVEPELASEGISILFARHPALTLSFRESAEINTQKVGQVNLKRLVRHVHLEYASEVEVGIAERTETSNAHKRVNFSNGPLMQTVFFHLGKERGTKLFITIHHLAVDGVSWRILIEEIEMIFSALRKNVAIEPRMEATPLRNWIHGLNQHFGQERFRKEKPFWSSFAKDAVYKLPWPGSDPGLEGDTATFWACLTPQETSQLLKKISSSVHVNEVLLTALVRALRKWAEVPSIHIDLEGHGRDDLGAGFDLSGTVGWFTSIYPLTFEINTDDEFSLSLQAIKKRLRSVPGMGLGYLFLKRSEAQKNERTAFQVDEAPSVCFNYFGNFLEATEMDRFWKITGKSPSPARGPKNPRTHYLKVTGRIMDHQLCMDWSFPDNFSAVEVVRALSDSFLNEIRSFLGQKPGIPTAMNLVHRLQSEPSKNSSLGYPYASPPLSQEFNHQLTQTGESAVRFRERSDQVLLTGATGYLGIHLLRQLLCETQAEIFCLVRADGAERARERLATKLRWYFPGENFSWVQSRIKAIPGDMLLPYFGLSSEDYFALADSVTSVFNAAADVRLVAAPQQLDMVNIGGVQKVLEFADSGRSKVVHHISTLSVFGSALSEPRKVFSERDFDLGQSFRNHYERSKFESEKLVRIWQQSGKTASIYRSSHIAANSFTGRFQENISANRLYLALRSSLRLGMAPFKPSEKIHFSYVDTVAKGIVKLALKKEYTGSTYHVENPHTLSHYDLFRALQGLGYPILILSEKDYAKLSVENSESGAFGLETVWGHVSSKTGGEYFDCSETVECLNRLGVHFKKPGTAWVRKMVQDCIERRFIAPPKKWKSISTPPEILHHSMALV